MSQRDEAFRNCSNLPGPEQTIDNQLSLQGDITTTDIGVTILQRRDMRHWAGGNTAMHSIFSVAVRFLNRTVYAQHLPSYEGMPPALTGPAGEKATIRKKVSPSAPHGDISIQAIHGCRAYSDLSVAEGI